MAIAEKNGLVTYGSQHSVDEVVTSISTSLKAKGITLFALIDHSGEAAKVGMTMRPAKLLIFGDPRAGTPVMQAAPSAAIDLPLKILVWQNEAGATQITTNTPDYLGARHQIPENLLRNISGAEILIAKAAD